MPKIGWMLDSSGMTATTARLFADFGFEALFLGTFGDEEI